MLGHQNSKSKIDLKTSTSSPRTVNSDAQLVHSRQRLGVFLGDFD